MRANASAKWGSSVFATSPASGMSRLVRPSQVLYELTSHLVLTKWRDPGDDPKLHLFGQLKRIAKQWLDGYLVCKGGTYWAPPRQWLVLNH